MDDSLGNGGDPETFVVRLDIPQHVMNQKWLLVLLIVGCTSLVFLICFPIDFYLYRRRKRLARERKNLTMYRPQTPTRASQIHAKVTVTKADAEIDIEEMHEDEEIRYRAERRIRKFLSMFKKKKPTVPVETLEFQEHLTELKSEKHANLEEMTKFRKSDALENRDDQALNACLDNNSENINSVSQDVNDSADFIKNNEITNSVTENSESFPKGKFSNVSMAWSENEDLFKHGNKRLKNGAKEPLENMTNVVNDKNDKYCFTIPVRSRNLVNLERETSNYNYADFEIHDFETNKNQKGVISESKTRPFPVDMCKDVTGFRSTRDFKSELSDTDIEGEDIKRETKTYQTVFNTGGDRNVTRYKILTHSQSDQLISDRNKHSQVSLMGGRKRNMVSPTDYTSFSFSETPCSDESFIAKERTICFSTPLEEQSLRSSVKKKKKKKKSYLMKRKSCNSMPEIPYENEKY